jgi:D-sedoheptulose 7-phosphate isomerase
MPEATKHSLVKKPSAAGLKPSRTGVKDSAAKESAAFLKHVTVTGLAARAAEFQRIVAATEVTGADGLQRDPERSLDALLGALKDLRGRGGRLYLVGNGGSAGVASHAVTDFLNVGKLRASTLHDPSLLTCMSNDYGYDAAFARILSTVASHGDMLVAISSSGQSANIRNAAAEMRNLGGMVVTLSGFKLDNPLRSLGDFNFWLDSTDYGMVEIGHQFLLHNLADRLRLGM